MFVGEVEREISGHPGTPPRRFPRRSSGRMLERDRLGLRQPVEDYQGIDNRDYANDFMGIASSAVPISHDHNSGAVSARR